MRSAKWAVVVSYLVAAIIGVLSVLYAQHLDRQDDRRWCALIIALDSSYRRQPPTTPTGQELASNIATLRRLLEC